MAIYDVLSDESREQVLTAAAIEQIVKQQMHEQYTDHGYGDDYGFATTDKLRLAAIGMVAEDPVLALVDRETKAWTQDGATRHLFPRLHAPGMVEYDAGGAVAEALWKKISGNVWRVLDPKVNSTTQRKLGKLYPDLVLVKAEIPIGEGMRSSMQWAVYATHDGDLLLADFAKPFRVAVAKAAEAMAANLAMVGQRNDELAERLAEEVNEVMAKATDLARARLALSSGD